MNKQLFIDMRRKILCMQETVELKEMMEFFVLQLPEVVQLIAKLLYTLKNKWLRIFELNFNSLYWAPNSLYWLNLGKFEFSVSGTEFSKNEKIMVS
jgi:hypothetical protein